MQLVQNFDDSKHPNDVLPFFYLEKEPYEIVPDFDEILKNVITNIVSDYYLNILNNSTLLQIGLKITEYLNQCHEVKDKQVSRSDLKITINYQLHSSPLEVKTMTVDFNNLI